MESALAWIGKIFEWIGAFIPRWVVLDTTEASIKFVRGRPVYCAPGAIHWYWPATTKWIDYPVARQSDRLETQVMESKDGKAFIASGTLTYAINDLMALLPLTHSAMTTIIEIASTAMHDVLCDMTWDEIAKGCQGRQTLKTQLKNVAQEELKEYGVQVIRFKLNSLARCRVYRLSQSNSSEEN